MDPRMLKRLSQPVARKLKHAYRFAKANASKGLWPLYGAVATAPVIGYQADKLREEREAPTNNPEMLEQRTEGTSMPPDSVQKTAKQAALGMLKDELRAAKQRRRIGLLGGEDQSREAPDDPGGVSFQPGLR